MKKQDKKKERRSSFFDSNGDGEDTSDGSSVNMIYLCEFVPEEFKEGDYDDVEDVDAVGWDEESAFVFVTMKMEAAFNAMFFAMLNWICIDSACNVNLMNFLPVGITNYVLITQGFGISTAGKDGHLTIVATFTWGNVHGIKYCPSARASLFSTNFFMERMCQVLFTGLRGTDECKILCRIGTDVEDDMAAPRRVELAAPHGGLFWISPAFQLDLVMRNGLTTEMEEDLLREIDHGKETMEDQVAIVACEMISAVEQAAEEDEYFAVPWEIHPVGDNGGDMVIMRALQFSRDSYYPCAVSEQTVYRGAAVVNPYVKRFMVEEEMDVQFVGRIKHPKFTHAEDIAFKDFTMVQREDSHQKNGRSMSAKERGAAEHKFFKAWSNNRILPPVPLSEIIAAPVVIVTPVNDNNNNIFYFQDFTSELVRASSVGGSTSYKANPVCSLACSASVDVLGLMHERTGHFNKRGLIECVKSKIVSGLKIEDKDI